MIVSLNVLLIMFLTAITYQDFKERKVFWFLFPLAMLVFGLLYYFQVASVEVFLYQILINSFLITGILIILFLYTRLIVKKRFLDHSLGLGDILFFYALGLGFPTLTFIVLFVGATVFSLLVFLIRRRSLTYETVPLAGLMALFIIFIMLYSFISKHPPLYGY